MATNPETKPEVPWSVSSEQRSPSVQVQMLKVAFVLPWIRFLYAEGDPSAIQIAFSTHDVVVKGCGLDRLLEDVAAQRVTAIPEPARTDRFATDSDRVRIVEVNVREVVAQE